MSKKMVTLEQLLESARQSEALAMQVAEAAAASIEGKQDKLTGAAGQVVGFDENGEVVAQVVPQTGLTQDQADARYLKLTGGQVSGELSIQGVLVGNQDGETYLLYVDENNVVRHGIEFLYGRSLIEIMDLYGNLSSALTIVSPDLKNTIIPEDDYDSVVLRGVESPVFDYDAANKKYVDDAMAGKQDKLTGKAGQIVGFNSDGNAVPQTAPSTGANLVAIKFVGPLVDGESYTVKNGSETYNGTAHVGETILASVQKDNAKYQVTCNGINYSIRSKKYGVIPYLEFESAYCQVEVSITGLLAGEVVDFCNVYDQESVQATITTTPGGGYVFFANRPGTWLIQVASVTTSGKPRLGAATVEISADDTIKTVTVSIT